MSDQIIKNIYQRMIEVQKKVTSVEKALKVSTGNDRAYKAVSHDDVAALLHLPLAEAGIVLLPDVLEYSFSEFKVQKKDYTQNWYRTDIKIKVKWVNADKPDEFIESTGAAYAVDTSDKSFSKAYSLALKIVLLKVHLLESKDQEEERIFDGVIEERQQTQRTEKKAVEKKPAVQSELSEAQLKRLFAMANEMGWTKDAVKEYMLENFKIDSTKLLTKFQYDKLCAAIENSKLEGPSVAGDPTQSEAKKEETNSPLSPAPATPKAIEKDKASEVGKPDAPTPVTYPSKPPEFVVTAPNEMWQELHGKALSEIEDETLNDFREWLLTEIKSTPAPKGMFGLLKMEKEISEYFKRKFRK